MNRPASVGDGAIPQRERALLSATAILLNLALYKLVLYLLTAGNYG